MRVNLFGTFAVALGESRAGPWPRPSAKRLCALVFLSRGRRILREVACETLFGDLVAKAAAHALYNALSAARAVLADLGGTAANMLGSDRAFIYISPSALVEVDLDRHEEALRAALAMAPGTDRDAALAHALYEQGVLLEDEPYADWALRPREALDLARQEARLALARDRSAWGRPVEARARHRSLGGIPGSRAGVRRGGRRLDGHVPRPRGNATW